MRYRTLVTGIFACLLLGAGPAVAADSLGDFFKRLGDSIAKAGRQQPSAHRSPAKTNTTRKLPDKANPQQNQNGTAAPNENTAAPSPTATPGPMVRPALPVAENKGRKRDLPYGIPVPGQQGFVTSPFAPDVGYVDVRNFAPGTEVKDPYTGRTFLTP